MMDKIGVYLTIGLVFLILSPVVMPIIAINKIMEWIRGYHLQELM